MVQGRRGRGLFNWKKEHECMERKNHRPIYHKVKKSKSNKGDEMAYTKTTKIATFRILVETLPLSLLPLLPMSSVLQKFSPPPSYDIPRGALSQSRVISLPPFLPPLHYAYSPLHTLTLRNFSFPPLPPGKNFFLRQKMNKCELYIFRGKKVLFLN